MTRCLLIVFFMFVSLFYLSFKMKDSFAEEATLDSPEFSDSSSDLAPLKSNESSSPSNDWQKDTDFSELEKDDDLKSLKDDLGEEEKISEKISEKTSDESSDISNPPEIVNDELKNADVKEGKKNIVIFDVGKEEKKLLELSKLIENKIQTKDWDEVASNNKVEKYTIVEGEYLWKISKRLFGSGFYYAKIWSLNSYITNPHEVKPGMVLLFTTGDSVSMPKIRLGSFDNEEGEGGGDGDGKDDTSQENFNSKDSFRKYGDGTEPEWLKEKQALVDKGHYFSYSTEKTYNDLKKMGEKSLVREYEQYSPPKSSLVILPPSDKYDETGFSKESKVNFTFKEGLSLTTFISSNIVQDLGEIDSSDRPDMFLSKNDRIFVKFLPSVKAMPGDLFSIYTSLGEVTHPLSDRSGYKYTIVGEIKVIKKVSSLWECEITDSTGVIQRKDRLTIHTPPINKIISTFNTRMIEAIAMAGFSDMQETYSYGDVVYIDRGRADGVEMGNVLELYSFQDGMTDRKITPDPAYKIGELTIISLSDNFSTALITQSSHPIYLGTLAITKTKEKVALAAKIKNKKLIKNLEKTENKVLDNLDTELVLDDINEDLLKKAQSIELTEDELAELEKQEREKSFIQKNDQDLKDLEQLEAEIESVESKSLEKRKDEDKLLEGKNLNELEKKMRANARDVFDSLNEIERKKGQKYIDEDINSKENPYGLTKFDIEEVDALLNDDQALEKTRTAKKSEVKVEAKGESGSDAQMDQMMSEPPENEASSVEAKLDNSSVEVPQEEAPKEQ